MKKRQHQPLDYATPGGRDDSGGARKLAAGCLGAVVAILALPFLVRGIVALFEVTKGWNRFVRSDHAGAGMISLAIGLFGVIVAGRWLRHAFRRRDSDAPQQRE